MKRTKYILILAFACLFLTDGYAQRYMDNAIRRPDDYKQRIRLGVRAGVNLSDFTSAEGLDIWNGLAFFDLNENYIGFTDTRSKIGFNAGVTAQARLTGNWWWQASLIYTRKGYKLNTQEVEMDVTADYIQLPIDILYKFPLDEIDLVGSLGLYLGVGARGYSNFTDHYGESDVPRQFHQDLQAPYINETLGTTNLTGCDYTVHGANVYWYDQDNTFKSDGTYRLDAGVQLGMGIEWWRFQFMINYQFSLTYFYNYNYDFSGRYDEFAGKYVGYHNSFEWFGMDIMTSPRLHMLSFTVTYFFDNFKHNLKI